MHAAHDLHVPLCALRYAVDGEAERNRKEHGRRFAGARPDALRVLRALLGRGTEYRGGSASVDGSVHHDSSAPSETDSAIKKDHAEATPLGLWEAALAAAAARLRWVLNLLLDTCIQNQACVDEAYRGGQGDDPTRAVPLLTAALGAHDTMHKVVSTYLLRRGRKRSPGTVRHDVGMDPAAHDAFASWGLEVPLDAVSVGGLATDPSVLRPVLLQWVESIVRDILAACHAGWRCAAVLEAADRGTLRRPLHAAAVVGSVVAVKELLAAGANPMAVDARGRTAADLAMLAGYEDVVALLQVGS